jgi:hypothetical protein
VIQAPDDLGGCGVQVVIPMANERLDVSGSEIGETVEGSRPIKLLDKRMSRDFVLAVSRKLDWSDRRNEQRNSEDGYSYLEGCHRHRHDVLVAFVTDQNRHLSTFPFDTK